MLWQVKRAFLPGPGMRAYERDLFSYLRCMSGEWHSKTRISFAVYAAVSPHPNPLPVGEGAKNSRW